MPEDGDPSGSDQLGKGTLDSDTVKGEAQLEIAAKLEPETAPETAKLEALPAGKKASVESVAETLKDEMQAKAEKKAAMNRPASASDAGAAAKSPKMVAGSAPKTVRR